MNVLLATLENYVSFQTVNKIHVGMEQLVFLNPTRMWRAFVHMEELEFFVMMVRAIMSTNPEPPLFLGN